MLACAESETEMFVNTAQSQTNFFYLKKSQFPGDLAFERASLLKKFDSAQCLPARSRIFRTLNSNIFAKRILKKNHFSRLSGALMGSIQEKNRGKQFCDTAP